MTPLLEGPPDRGPVMQLHSGREFYPLDPHPSEITIGTIAASLSKLCRFNGHCTSFYSVAQHSILVARNMPEEGRLEGLLHDAHEAFIGDITRPMKQALAAHGLALGPIVDRIDAAIATRFGLDFARWRDTIKEVDLRALATERRDLMRPTIGGWEWQPLPEPYPEELRGWEPDTAREGFEQVFLACQELRV